MTACVIEAALRVISDGVDAELCEHRDNAIEGSTHRRRRVDQRFSEADDVHLSGVEVLQCLDQNALTTSEPIEAASFEGVPRPEVVETGQSLRPIGDAAGLAVVNEHPFAARGAQLRFLRLGVLLSLRDAGVTDFVCHAENGTAIVPARLGFRQGVSAGQASACRAPSVTRDDRCRSMRASNSGTSAHVGVSLREIESQGIGDAEADATQY